jgi:hypothetical protein
MKEKLATKFNLHYSYILTILRAGSRAIYPGYYLGGFLILLIDFYFKTA